MLKKKLSGHAALTRRAPGAQLAPYKETARPLLDALEDHAWLPFALLGAPALLLLGALARLFSGGRVRAQAQ